MKGPAAAAAVALVTSACAPAPPIEAPPIGTISAAPSAAPVKLGPAANTMIRVVHKDDWFGAVELVGVDTAGKRAVVRLAHPSPERVYVDTIDLGAGQRAERWELAEGPTERAIAGRGFPVDTSVREDALRFAELILPLGPWHTRPALASPTFAAASDLSFVVFGSVPPDGSSPDWLYAMGTHGTPKRVDEKLKASYAPVVGPGNDVIAFRGCEATPCDYGLYVAPLGGGPHRVRGIARSTPPVFSLDGASVFSVGDGDVSKRERCAFRTTADGKRPAERLACVQGRDDVTLSIDPESKTGVLSGSTGRSGEQHVTFTWFDVASGKTLGEETIALATGGGILGERGLFAAPMQKGGIAFADLANARFVVLPEEENWFFGFEAARFIGDDLVLLRKPEGIVGFEIVRLAARTLVDVLGRSAKDAGTGSGGGFIPPSF